MSTNSARPRDPIGWCWIIAAGFLGLVMVRLAIPSTPYFDELHYLPAARALLDLSGYPNQEHPLAGKELLAAGIKLFGDHPPGWRIMPAIFGAIALFAAMRALWFARFSRYATIAYGLLLASGFHLFVHARIAMLDVFMVAFCAIAAWQFAGALREPESGRWRLALSGVALGLAMASKWNAIPLAVLPGLAFLVARAQVAGWRFALTSRAAPVPGITLAEAALWLGLVPLAVYWLTFAPAYWLVGPQLDRFGFVGLQQHMVALQESVRDPHPYQSNWQDWMLNARAIWYLYEPVDGAQRGVLLIGNPLTMLLGLPALAWCLWAAIADRRMDALGVALAYAASLGLWIVAGKPVQFYYHYFLPSMALLAALALALDRLRETGRTWIGWLVPAASLAIFAWFYPILSAAPLDGEQAFAKWMWLDSWR